MRGHAQQCSGPRPGGGPPTPPGEHTPGGVRGTFRTFGAHVIVPQDELCVGVFGAPAPLRRVCVMQDASLGVLLTDPPQHLGGHDHSQRPITPAPRVPHIDTPGGSTSKEQCTAECVYSPRGAPPHAAPCGAPMMGGGGAPSKL